MPRLCMHAAYRLVKAHCYCQPVSWISLHVWGSHYTHYPTFIKQLILLSVIST
jgi:hypothetical protein